MQSPTRPEIIETLTNIFRKILDTPTLILRDDLTAADVEKWDSLNHIDLIVAIERQFKIKFTTREVSSLRNVGQLADLTQTKVNAAR